MYLNKKLAIFLLIVTVIFVYGVYLMKREKFISQIPIVASSITISSSPETVASDSAEIAVVQRVVDGDTIELSDGRKVRYIGVDTPELHHPTKSVQCFGKEAMEKNKELVEGKEIQMKKDVSETDRYKRLLRYVWIGDVFVNEYLAREGFAHQATFPPDVKYVDQFKIAAEDARVNNKGLWNVCIKKKEVRRQ